MPGIRVDTEFAFLVKGTAEQLLGDLRGQPVGRQIVGDVSATPVGGLDVGAVASDTHVDTGIAKREGRQPLRVDVTEFGDELLQARGGVPVGAAVEVGEDLQSLGPAARDLVEQLL